MTALLLALSLLLADEPPTNRLGRATSPYLRLHADNPVHWHPWEPEAFERAKRENKPILLSVGYSACHWCHVMNKESFQDPEIAKLLNEHFICIKVDREERPDVDKAYLDAVQAMTGSGGWPLSVFLLPDGRPFFGGTYFPPRDRVLADGETMLGFQTLITRVHTAYEKDRDKLEKRASNVASALERLARASRAAETLPTLEEFPTIIAGIHGELDPIHGGLGQPPRFAPKFPQASTLLLLLEGNDDSVARARLQADQMGMGGMFDHVGGGFHRYAVDRTWTVPHFEKMLYDQGLLLVAYARLFAQTNHPPYEEIMSGVVKFLTRELRSPDHLFYSSIDADSEGEEGVFYVWTRGELEQILGGEQTWALPHLGVDREPNFEGKYVLTRRHSDPPNMRAWEKVRELLFTAREKRPRPRSDTKELASWNGLALWGLSESARSTKNPAVVKLARETASAVRLHFFHPDGSLAHQRAQGKLQGKAFLDDYAALALGLSTASALGERDENLRAARALADVILSDFWDDADKVLRYTAKSEQSLPLPLHDATDGAIPSPAGLAVEALVTLAKETGEARYADAARVIFLSLGKQMKEEPIASAMLLLALKKYHGLTVGKGP